MEDRTATLESSSDDSVPIRPTQAYPNQSPRAQPMKFIYSSGARPLDGYTIKRGVGRGGFGEVYYATSDGGKDVALKLIRRNLDIELRGVSQCLNLKHPHLLALFDIKHDDEDNIWVVMEYVGGETLDQVIDRNPEGLPVPEALAWIHGIGAGVAYLHDRGIVHRDLKPGNVFCDEGVVKLGDYGLSKFISASRRSGQTESVGTVHYMAPEVANGRYGKEIDIYALGVMLYEMLTGHVPFEGESVGEVLMKHLTAQPQLDDLAEPFRTIVARSLEKDPERRFRTVEELLAALPQPATADLRVNPGAIKPPVTPTIASPQPADARDAAIEAELINEPRNQGVSSGKEDPVWIAIRDLLGEVRRAWREANLSTPWRVVLMILGIFVLISGSGFIITALVLGSIAYLIYRIFWSLGWIDPTNSKSKKTPHAAAGMGPAKGPAAAAEPPISDNPAGGAGMRYAAAAREVAQAARSWREQIRRPTLKQRRDQAIAAHLMKAPREKLTDLIGSMLLAAGVAIVLPAAMFLFTGIASDNPLAPAQFAWLAMVGTAGAWGILVPAKFWEGSAGEPAMRRFVLLIVGLGLGAIAYAVDTGLLVDLHYASSSWFPGGSLPRPWRSVLFDEAGDPTLSLYMTYFGLLLPVLRWWKLADIRRRHRFDLWSVAGCALWAYILCQFVEFPESWGAAAAAVIAAAIQLSSPWINPRPRSAARQAA